MAVLQRGRHHLHTCEMHVYNPVLQRPWGRGEGGGVHEAVVDLFTKQPCKKKKKLLRSADTNAGSFPSVE